MSLNLITDLVVRLSRTGAGAIVMWFMVVLSIVSVTVMIERLIFFFSHKDDVRGVAAELNRLLLAGDYSAARKLLENAKGFETRVLLAALDGAHLGKNAVQELAASAQKMERLRFERGLAFLGTVGNNAPFIGLFGTVLEIVSALYELGTQSGGNAGAAAVMATLSQALAATAVGLVVALPAVAAYNYFNRRIKMLQTGAEALVHVLLAHMKDEPKKATDSAAGAAKATAKSSPKVDKDAGVKKDGSGEKDAKATEPDAKPDAAAKDDKPAG